MGEVPWYTVYGYRKGWEIEEKEAAVVRSVFRAYAQGDSISAIVSRLNKEGVPTPRGSKKWEHCVIAEMLRNERYVGDAMMQKTYVSNFVTHKRVDNRNADIEKYYRSNHHQPIVDRETFHQVQRIITMQSTAKGSKLFPYYGILKCPYCGLPMIKVWIAGTVRQSAWTCGGTGPEQLLRKRTGCPTYLLQERLMERTLQKAVMGLDTLSPLLYLHWPFWPFFSSTPVPRHSAFFYFSSSLPIPAFFSASPLPLLIYFYSFWVVWFLLYFSSHLPLVGVPPKQQ